MIKNKKFINLLFVIFFFAAGVAFFLVYILTRKDDAKVYLKLIPLHETKIKPGPYDWLAVHDEQGQSYEEYLKLGIRRPDPKKDFIYVALLGDFDQVQKGIVEKTAKYIEAFYGLPVKFIKDIPFSEIPDKARRMNPVTFDSQILSTYVLEDVLVPRKPKDAFGLIAFTTSDLWPGKGWNFVFGMADPEARVGVWSIARDGDPHKKEEYQLCLRRVVQTGAHEVGHIFGLHHCIFFECAMNGSNHREESDKRPMWLCPICMRKLLWMRGGRLKEYLKKMENIHKELGFDKEASFFGRQLEALRGF